MICAVVDLMLSYNYFLYNGELFVSTESNVEFVRFLMTGDFPFHNFIKFIIALPLLLFVLSWFDMLHENIRSAPMLFIERFGRIFTVAIPSFFCISYSCSGFTWYSNSPIIYDILTMIESMIHSSMMIVVVSLFLLTFYLFCDQQKTL